MSLLLAEGRAIHYVATQAGHDAQLTLSTYGHLLAEYADADRIDAEQEIQQLGPPFGDEARDVLQACCPSMAQGRSSAILSRLR